MISFFDADKLEAFRQEHKIDPYRLKQVQLEIFKNSCLSFDDMTSLPKDLRSLFAEHISIVPFVVTKCQEDDEVVKFLFAMPDDPDNVFETVLMYHYSAHVQDKLNRMTLCISSQV
ncbi:hypothetical protein GW750_06050 [bacterium]|nr:hypothetical protein [bacterium]